MKPIYFTLNNGSSLIVLPENKERDNSHSCTFQLYVGSPANKDKSLKDLNNYSGMISFNPASQAFYFTPGNRAISSDEVLKIIECIKTKIY